MRHRLKHINLANDRHNLARIGDGRTVIVDKTSDIPAKELDSPQQESLRSYRAVYQIARFALDNPSFWIRQRIRRISWAYGPPMVWGALGCVVGLGVAIIHQRLTPSVLLPSTSDMNDVFTVHDINELLLASHNQIGTH
jgi:hypothetical protein